MDMWKAFRKSTLKEGHAPQARIIYALLSRKTYTPSSPGA
jgi:hypothetical protein